MLQVGAPPSPTPGGERCCKLELHHPQFRASAHLREETMRETSITTFQSVLVNFSVSLMKCPRSTT